MIFFVSIGGGLLFFAFIFLLFALEGLAGSAQNNVISFLDENVVTIAVILSIIILLVSTVITYIYNKSSDSVAQTVFYAIGLILVLSQLALVLYQLARSPFEHNYGSILMIFSVIISVVLYLVDLGITVGCFGLGTSYKPCIILMYIWAILGAIIFGDFLKIIIPGV